MMDELGATTGEDSCGEGSLELWWLSAVVDKAEGTGGFAAVVD